MCKLHIYTSDTTELSMPTQIDALQTDREATLASISGLLAPIAKLCIAKGLPIQAVEELIRNAFVQAARNACDGVKPDRAVSRISTMTGLTRREVGRLVNSPHAALPATRSHASDILTRWITRPEFANEQGQPRPLPRSGEGASFESLAWSVTRDVHPRTLLAEMERLELVEFGPENETVALRAHAFVPRADWQRMVGFLGENVGDHLHAAVVNVLGTGTEHFEQSLLADELSEESLGQVRKMISQQWTGMMASMGPQLEALMAEDRSAGRPQNQSVRIGFYSWTQPMPTACTPPAATPPTGAPKSPES